MKYAWVKATNLSDKLTIPEITIETEGNPVNGWYGADKKELWIKVSTNSPSAKEIYYTLLGAHIQEETKGELKEENGMKYIKVPITEIGLTRIIAHTEDGNGYSSEENSLEVKFDNIPPILEVPIRTGTEGTNSWYKSDIDVMVNAKDLNGKEETSLKDPKATLNGYIYKVLKEDNTEIIQETHIKDIEKAITTRDIDNGKDGIYILHIKAIDEAGNTSSTQVIELRKDTAPPLVEVPQITNVTETGFQLTVSAGDTTSGIAYYEYYIDDTKADTRNEGIWMPNDLSPNSIYNVKVVVYDNAGNSAQSVNVPVTTQGELLAPNVSISGTQRNGYYIGTVTVTVNDTSASGRSRVARIKVTGAGSERTITGTSGSFTITADGTYTISAWSEDASGNRSTTTSKPSFTRDATKPSKASLTLGTVEEKTIAVTASGADATSGVASYKFEYKLSTASTWSTAGTKSTTATSTPYTYTGLTGGTTYNLRVTVTDKAGNTYTGNSINGTTEPPPIIPSATTDIGKYVNYKPTSGNYTAEARYSGNTSDQMFSTETALKWRIWNVDSTTLYLISDQPTTTKLTLNGALGYNNGVTLLDNICNSCYKNSSYSGITARNLKVEDVTAITIVSNNFASDYGTQPYTYTFTAPYIWTTYEKSSWSNAENNRSTAYSLTTTTTSNASSIKPYWTLWYNDRMNTTSAYKNAKYKELVVEQVSDLSKTYWFSSRFVTPTASNNCIFGLQIVYPNGVFYNYLYYKGTDGAAHSITNSYAVRPIVSIPLTCCKLTISNTPGIDFVISPR